MTTILGRMFGRREDESTSAYTEAMNTSNDLVSRMRKASRSTDAVRAVMSDIWSQHHNMPFLTTVYQSVQEVKSGLESDGQ